MTHRAGILMLLVSAFIALQIGAQSAPDKRAAPGASAANQTPPSLRRWSDRLEALRPSSPMSYFELAEEIADAKTDKTQLDMAKRLFGLAGALDPDHLGRSACLALADLEDDAAAKRRLVTLAALLGADLAGHSSPAAVLGTGANSVSPAAAYAVSSALSHYRRGRGSQALAALKEPGALELLTKYERMLPGGILRFQEDCKLYTTGKTKPSLSSGEVARMLRFEAALLAGADRDWSSQILLTGGQPLVEVDPSRLDESLGVDLLRPYFRRGRWSER